ncbi:MAG: DUF6263 family protein [Phycisphaerales bacterium]
MRIAWLAAVVLACAPMALAQKAGSEAGGQSPAQATAGAIDLRPRFEAGKEFRFTLEQASTTKRGAAPANKGRTPKTGKPGKTGMPDADATSSTITMGLVMKVVKGGGDGDSTVEFVIDALKISVKGGEMETEFDSTKPAGDDDLIATMLKSLVGSSFTATIDRTGNIKSVSGGEALAALGQLGGGGLSGLGGGAAGGGGGGFLGPIVNTGAGSGFARIGQSWENSDAIGGGMLGPFKMVTKHTLASMRGKEAVVDFKGKLDAASEAPGSGGSGGGAQVRDTSYSGQYHWDTGEGMLKKMDSTMRVTMETQGEEQRELTTSEVKTTITRGTAGKSATRPANRGNTPAGTTPSRQRRP